jgi:hypothetical protein
VKVNGSSINICEQQFGSAREIEDTFGSLGSVHHMTEPEMTSPTKGQARYM